MGLCGETLRDQSRFLQSSIKAVLSLYKSSKPRSVILVGHSIGGVIARSLFLLDDFDVSSVSIILTFASPNLAPVVSADYNVAQFYQEVKLYWKLNADKMKNISVLSVSGGDNDVQVRHSLTRLPTEQANHLSTSLYTIPRVQLTTDHLAVVWCKQLVLVTSRFLFSLIDKNTRQMTENTEKRNLLMSYYFGSSYQSINSSLILNVKLKLSSAYLRKTVSQLSWSEKLDKEDVGVYYTFDIKQYLDQNATDFVAEISLQHKQWILVSGENYTGVRDISSHSFHSGKSQRIRFDLRWLFEKGFFNVLIRVPKNKPIDHLSVNVLRPGEYVVIDVPNVFSNIWTLGKGFNYSLDSKTRFYYRLRLNGISNVHQNFDVRLHDPLGYFELETSWDKGLSLNGSNKINVKLRNVPAADDIVILHVYTSLPNPELTIRANFVGLLTQLCRHFSTCLPVLMVANLLLTYSYLIKQHKVEIINQELSQAHSIGAKPYKVVPFVSLIHFLYSYDWFANTWRTFGLPLPDTHLLQNEHQVWFGLAPLVLFFFAYELFVVEMKLQSIINYFLTFAMKLFPIKFHDYVYNAKYFRASFHILFLSALMSINYSLALFYMYVASVFGTCCMSLVENSMRRKDGSNSKGMKHRISNTSMRIITSQIWLWLFLYNLPSLLFAVKRYKNKIFRIVCLLLHSAVKGLFYSGKIVWCFIFFFFCAKLSKIVRFRSSQKCNLSK